MIHTIHRDEAYDSHNTWIYLHDSDNTEMMFVVKIAAHNYVMPNKD